jgi:putative lipoic acid-binding regulatory protein
MIKVIGHMGDGLENLVLGLISSILPKNNSIAQQISKTSKSNYFFKKQSNLVIQCFLN